MKTHRLMSHLETLSVKIGPRYGGSDGNHRAAAYIARVFDEAGLAVERQKFSCPRWQDFGAQLWIAGEPLPAVSNAFSTPCDVQVPVEAASSLAELEQAKISGKIVVLYGRLTQSPLFPKAWFLLSADEKRLIDLLEARQPAAVITVQTRPGELERLIEDWEFTIPSATVNAAVGQTFLQSTNKPVRLQIKTEIQTGFAENILGRTGSDASAKVVLCAHYDTKIDTPGAFDNGSGTAVLLALAERFGRQRLPFQLEFVAFSNEEYLPLGDDEYIRHGEQSLDQIIAAVNIDAVGQTLGSNSIALFAGSAAFEELITGIVDKHPGIVWVDPWPASNHYTFYSRGVPSIALSSVGHIHNIHLRSDTSAAMSEPKLAEPLELVSDILMNLGRATPEWTRE